MGGSTRFHEILKELGDLHELKNKDYGREGDPYANVRGSLDWGVPAWVGAMVRATDKVKRLQQYVRSGTLANEGVEDSLRDLAVYAIIGLVLWQEQCVAKAPYTSVEAEKTQDANWQRHLAETQPREVASRHFDQLLDLVG